MPPQAAQTLTSPAELSYLHTSLTLTPPIRPDLRTPTQFRPLVAETSILPTPNGSARVCFSDGTEAIAGVKAEVERTPRAFRGVGSPGGGDEDVDSDEEEDREGGGGTGMSGRGRGEDAWLRVSVEIPSHRDDDPLPIFLGAMLTESLLSTPTSHNPPTSTSQSQPPSLRDRLYINPRWHWKLYIDLLMLSPPLSYPLPLVSLALHLALLDTRLPRLVSEPEDDPLWDDDWEAAGWLYPRADEERSELMDAASASASASLSTPPITLLVMTAGTNIFFDPSATELAVADAVVAVSLAQTIPSNKISNTRTNEQPHQPKLTITALRTINPPSRLTPPGVPTATSTTTSTSTSSSQSTIATTTTALQTPTPKQAGLQAAAEKKILTAREEGTVWCPPRGGVKRCMLAKVVAMCTERGGVGEDVFEGLAGGGWKG